LTDLQTFYRASSWLAMQMPDAVS